MLAFLMALQFVGCGTKTSTAPPKSYSISDLVSVVIEAQEQIAEGKLPRSAAEIERLANTFAQSVAGTSYEADAKVIQEKVGAYKAAVSKGGNKQTLAAAIGELEAKVNAVSLQLEKR